MMKSKNKKQSDASILPVFQTREETKKYYNKISKVYDLMADHSEAPVRRAGLKILAPREGERMLEVGFGTGHCLVDLAEAVGNTGKVYGIDLSEEMLNISHKRLKETGLWKRTQLACADATNMPYADRMMDGVFMSFTLELFDTPEIPLVLEECMRVLKSTGRIVVVGMSKEGGRDLMVKAFEWTHRHLPNFLDCRPIFVRRALEQAGLVIEETRLEHIWIPVEIVCGVKNRMLATEKI